MIEIWAQTSLNAFISKSKNENLKSYAKDNNQSFHHHHLFFCSPHHEWKKLYRVIPAYNKLNYVPQAGQNGGRPYWGNPGQVYPAVWIQWTSSMLIQVIHLLNWFWCIRIVRQGDVLCLPQCPGSNVMNIFLCKYATYVPPRIFTLCIVIDHNCIYSIFLVKVRFLDNLKTLQRRDCVIVIIIRWLAGLLSNIVSAMAHHW